MVQRYRTFKDLEPSSLEVRMSDFLSSLIINLAINIIGLDT